MSGPTGISRDRNGDLIWGTPREPAKPVLTNTSGLKNSNDTRASARKSFASGSGTTTATGDTKWHENKKPHPSTMARRRLHRGSISLYNDWNWQGNNVIYNRSKGGVRFNYLFNPSRIGVAWSVNNEYLDRALQSTEAGGTPDTTSMGPEGNAHVDIQLLLDRSPEVHEQSLPEGVLHDLGILQLLTMSNGLLHPQPVEVRTGQGVENNFRFVGMITNMSVDLTNFNEKMVPMRAAVSLNLVRFRDLMALGVLPAEAYGPSPAGSVNQLIHSGTGNKSNPRKKAGASPGTSGIQLITRTPVKAKVPPNVR
jgi:hypothetical protein